MFASSLDFLNLHVIFDPLIAMDPNPSNPILTVFVIAFFVSLLTTLANKLLVDQDKLNERQKRMKAFQKELRDAQRAGDGKKMAKLQSQQVELMQDQSKMMTDSFKPMIVTMVPILIIFAGMSGSVIRNIVVSLPLSAYYISLTPIWHLLGPIIYGGSPSGYVMGWLLWYFICTFGWSQILRKFLGFKQGF